MGTRAAVHRFEMWPMGTVGSQDGRVMVPRRPAGIPRALPRNEPPPVLRARVPSESRGPSRTRPVMCPHMCRDATRKRVHMPMETSPTASTAHSSKTCGVCKEILPPHMTETVRARSADRTRAGVARVEGCRMRCVCPGVCARLGVPRGWDMPRMRKRTVCKACTRVRGCG